MQTFDRGHRRALLTAAAMTLLVTGLIGLGPVGAGATAAQPVRSSVATITSFTPTTGGIGTTVTITGAGFAAPCSATFNGTVTTCSVKSAVKITASVPAGASTGPISVTTGGSTVATTTKFTVGLGLSLSATSGPPTSSVVVSATGFNPDEAVDLYFGTTDEVLVAANANGDFTYGGFPIPSSAQPGDTFISAVGRHGGLAAQAVFDVNTNWPEQGFGPSGNGHNPYENTIDDSNVGGLGESWNYAIGGNVSWAPTSAAVVNGVAYVSGGGAVTAVNAVTGSKIWTVASSEILYSPPAVANGIVYVVDQSDSVVDAFSASSGAPVWHTAVADASTLSTANGTVYVSSGTNSSYDLVALNAATGSIAWQITGSGGAVDGSVAEAKGTVYFETLNGEVIAYDTLTSAIAWQYQTNVPAGSSGAPLGSNGGPVLANGVLYVATGAWVFAINATTGSKVWSYETGGITTAPAVANGLVYVGSADHYVDIFDAATGVEVNAGADLGAGLSFAPTVANGVVYVGGSDGIVYALSPLGVVLWTFFTGGPLSSPPAVANGEVFIGSGDANLYAFSLAGGLASNTAEAVNTKTLRPNLALTMSR